MSDLKKLFFLHIKKFNNSNKKGFTLITILFVLMLLFIYVIALLSMADNVTILSSRQKNQSTSMAGAEAGIARAIQELSEDTYWPGEWGKEFPWEKLSDGQTQYNIQIYNNYHGKDDNFTPAGDRVPRGCAQVISNGCSSNDIGKKISINTFLRPNAKIPSLISKGSIELKGNVFSRGVMDIYSLKTTPASDIVSANSIKYTYPGNEFIIYGNVSSSPYNQLPAPSGTVRYETGPAFTEEIPQPPPEILSFDPNEDARELINELGKFYEPGDVPKVGKTYQVDAFKLSSLYPGTFYLKNANLQILEDTGPVVLNNVRLYVINGHIIDIPEGVTGNGLISATGIADYPGCYDPIRSVYKPSQSNIPASIRIKALQKLNYAYYPTDELVIYADGDIDIEGTPTVLSKGGIPTGNPTPLYDDWYNVLYNTIKERYYSINNEFKFPNLAMLNPLTPEESERQIPVSLENFIQDPFVINALQNKGVGQALIDNMKSYLIEGRPDYDSMLASMDCKKIVTQTNHNSSNPHSKIALQDILYSISRNYNYIIGMLYSRGNVTISGNIHIIGSIVQNSTDPNAGIIVLTENKTLLMTPCVISCLAISTNLLKEPRFIPQASVASAGSMGAVTVPTSTPLPPPPPPRPTKTPDGGGSSSGGSSSGGSSSGSSSSGSSGSSSGGDDGGGGSSSSSSSSGGASCFLPGTRVLTASGEKEIQNITPGDMVIGFDGKKTLELKVEKTLVHEESSNSYYIIKTEHSVVNVTPNHPFYIGNNNYEQIRNINEGDYIYTSIEGTLIKDKIISKELIKVNSYLTVYNIELEKNPHNFIANKFIVHNTMNLKM